MNVSIIQKVVIIRSSLLEESEKDYVVVGGFVFGRGLSTTEGSEVVSSLPQSHCLSHYENIFRLNCDNQAIYRSRRVQAMSGDYTPKHLSCEQN